MNTLVIGDLHSPFIKRNYLDHCVEAWNTFDCQRVVFIGDVIDNHYSSYHETDPDGLSAADELEMAISELQPWIDTFPDAIVTIGNHDRLVTRKAFSAGLSNRWVRNYSEVLNADGWHFVEEVELDGNLYQHGEGGTASKVASREQICVVQGHRHSEAYASHFANRRRRIWAMQVGCGIDRRSYAMAYAKTGPKPMIACGVVLDSGNLPIVVPMEMGTDD